MRTLWTVAFSAAACAFLILFSAPQACAQAGSPVLTPPPPRTDASTSANLIRRDVDMVLVGVTVTDPYGRLVTGLNQSNFHVYEDGVEQEIMHFDSEDVPVSVGVIFDTSSSMADKFYRTKMAAVDFMKTSNPNDEFFLVNFNDRASLVTQFTGSVDSLQDRLMFTSAHGSTALLDGIYLGLSQMRGASNARKALLIISDGGDNHSRYSESDIRRFVEESDVQIYAIGIYDPVGTCPTQEECNGPELLGDITSMTGGRMYAVHSEDQLKDVAEKISLELRNQYVLGYRPSNRKRDGKYRKIKVKLSPPRGLPPLHVAARYGYYAPGP